MVVTENAVTLIVQHHDAVVLLPEDDIFHDTLVAVALIGENTLNGQPIEVWPRQFAVLLFGQVNDKHAVDFRLEVFPAACLPYHRLVQPLQAVFFPIFTCLAVRELVVVSRVAAVKNTAQLVETDTRNLIRLDGVTEELQEQLVFVVRQNVLDESQEVRCRLHDIRRELRLYVETEPVLMQNGTADCLTALSFRYRFSRFFE